MEAKVDSSGGEWSGEGSGVRPQQWGWTCELGRARELPGSLEREEGQSVSVFSLQARKEPILRRQGMGFSL